VESSRTRWALNLLRDHAAWLYRLVMIPFRLLVAVRHTCAGVGSAVKWAFSSREYTNFTYDLSDANLETLAQTLSVVTGFGCDVCRSMIDEALTDEELRAHVILTTEASKFGIGADRHPRYARRLGWYALVRLLRPKIVVETGVDKGLGSVLLCSALLRNRAEGWAGYYFGTDINPEAGWLLRGRYADTGKILVGDSIDSLRGLESQVDLFINDSDHSADYEAREYAVIATKLSSAAVVLGDNSHETDALERFSRAHGRSYLFFKEQPVHHWYRGAGIGFSFPCVRVVER
jgi:hypothetical protein